MTYFAETPKDAFIETLTQNDDRGEALDYVLERAERTLAWVKEHQTTVVRDVTVNVAMPGTVVRLRRANLDEWGGTFATAADAILQEVNEGELSMSILALDPDDHASGALVLYRGVAHSFTGGTITFFDGVTIDRELIFGLGI